MDTTQKRTWAEIDLARLEENYRALRGLLAPGCRFLGVVKADAYGHGAVPVARRLETLGAEYLGVSCLDEAAELRAAGLTAPILVLGYTPPEFAPRLLELGLTQTIFDGETAVALSKAACARGQTLKIHLKADTGMSRLGFLCHENSLEAAAGEMAAVCALPGLEAEGIFTHFASADGDEDYTLLQLNRFAALLDRLSDMGASFAIRHCANSAAVLHYPQTQFDMVRPGLALYGHYPAPGLEGRCILRPVMELKTRVAALRDLPAGTPVSYGGVERLARDGRLAVLPVGYADGFFRSLSGRARVLVGGMPARVVGRVCMDMCMVDVTEIPDVKPGDEVTIFGCAPAVEENAAHAGTISYELLCAVSKRVPRRYD